MKKGDIERITLDVEIPTDFGDGLLTVSVTGTVKLVDNGIGSYEYWGSKCYDIRIEPELQDNLKWDSKEFSEAENDAISKYLDDNFDGKISELFINEYQRIYE